MQAGEGAREPAARLGWRARRRLRRAWLRRAEPQRWADEAVSSALRDPSVEQDVEPDQAQEPGAASG